MNQIRSSTQLSCGICGGRGILIYANLRDRIFQVPGEWSLRHCRICHHIWIDPRPIAEDIPILYREYFVPKIESEKSVKKNWRDYVMRLILGKCYKYSVIKTNFAEEFVGHILCEIGPIRNRVGRSIRWLPMKKGKLLDVGCGSGLYLARMRKLGWEVFGLEPNPITVGIGQKYLGLNIIQETLENAPFPSAHFDAITMDHVLEHLPDPVAAFEQTSRLLKPGGYFVAITPNNESLCHRIFKSSYVGLDPPRHFHLFSKLSINKLLIKAGFRSVFLKTLATVGRNEWSMSRLIKKGISPRSIWLYKHLLYEEKLFYLLELLLNPFKLGEEVVLMALKG